MRWFYELAWLWKGLGISLLAAAACMVCVWLGAEPPESGFGLASRF
ncbi:MAG: hypothetical protein ACLSHO_03225 [Dysosmobacter sp.]